MSGVVGRGGPMASTSASGGASVMPGGDLNEPSRQAPPDLSNIVHLKRSESYFMSDELRSELIRKNLLTLAVPTQELAIRN